MNLYFRVGIPVGVVITVGLGAWVYSIVHPTSDHALIMHFSKNRACFEEIVRMAHSENGVARIAPRFITLRGKFVPTLAERRAAISDDRWERYKTLFSCAGVGGTPGGIGIGKDGVYLQAASFGFGGGWQKGYWWSEIDPQPRRTSLDGALDKEKNPWPMQLYRHIGGPWYLEIDWD